MYKFVLFLVAAIALLNTGFAFAEPENNLEVKILKDSSNQDLKIKFFPEILPINPGNTITWRNDDSVAHSITSGLPTYMNYSGTFFKTGSIAPSKSATIKTANLTNFAYYYFCEIHPWLTGKIVLSTAPESQPETINPIVTDRQSYAVGQDIAVSGQVDRDFAKTPYQILVYDNSDKLLSAIDGKFDEKATYKQTISTADLAASKYTLKVVYGLPTQVGITTFTLAKDQVVVPAWIKNSAGWWSSGKISDDEFIDAIQYLAKQNVIVIYKAKSADHASAIPAWVKTNASWWADGQISDSEFAKGLQYLVNSGIIQI